MSLCISISSIITSIGWIIAFVLGIASATYLDRRRSIRALIGLIESVRSEFHDSADFNVIHSDSIGLLKPQFFNALPLLNKSQKREALDAWMKYRMLDLNSFQKYGLTTVVAKAAGQSVVTEQDGIDLELAKLQSVFESVWW